MHGHQHLITMRRAGAVPDIVFVETSPELYAATDDWPRVAPTRAQLRVDPREPAHRLDLRVLVGLTVWVNGTDLHRVMGIAEACHRHQAARVIASVTKLDGEIVEMTDTLGDIVWPTC